jgi:hypothetical protein
MEDIIEYTVEKEKAVEEFVDVLKGLEEVKTKKEYKKNSTKVHEKKCKVVSNRKNFSIVDFDGFGLTVNKTNEKFVVIKYTGTVGSKDFKVIE